MTAELELWRDGWDVEPCDTAEPGRDSSIDPRLTALANAANCDGDGRAAGGKRRWVYLDKPIHDLSPDRRFL